MTSRSTEINGRHPFSEAQLDRVKRGVMSIQEGEAFCEAVRDLCGDRLAIRAAALAFVDAALNPFDTGDLEFARLRKVLRS